MYPCDTMKFEIGELARLRNSAMKMLMFWAAVEYVPQISRISHFRQRFMQWKRGGEDKVMSNAAKVINFWRNSSFFFCWCYISVYHFISFFWNLEIKFHTKIAPTACFQSWLRLHMLMLISASLSGTLIRYCWKIKFWRSRQICQSDFIT